MEKVITQAKIIYRSKDGFESFVVGEDEMTYLLEGNGIKCKVWKNTTKSKIKKVPFNYKLTKPIRV